MNLKLKAGLYTVGIVGGGYIGLTLIRAIFEVMPENWRMNVFAAIIVGALLYAVYNMVLSSLEISDKLKNIDRKSTRLNSSHT